MPDATGGDVGAQLKHHVSTGVTRYKKHYLNGVLTIGLVVIPAALINAVLGWIPVIGFIVAILVGLAQLLLVPLSAGAMGRWALAAAAGRDLHWKKAWKNALANPVQEWLNVALALLVTTFGIMLLIVPGLIVGMFALPAYLLEGKKFININARSAELVLKDAAGHLGLGLLTILCLIPVALVVALVTLILAFVPLVGGPLTTFLTVALNVFAAPFLYLLWAQIYFASVRRLEGGDPIAGHGPTIDSWSAAQ